MVNDISEYVTCESIVNLSDHLPVACNLAVPVQMIDTKPYMTLYPPMSRRGVETTVLDAGIKVIWHCTIMSVMNISPKSMYLSVC